MQIYFILSLIASIGLIVFAITNSTPVPVKIFVLQYELSLALIIFISTALGAIIATFIGFLKQFRLKKEIKTLTNNNEELILAQNKLLEENSSLKTSLNICEGSDGENLMDDNALEDSGQNNNL